jgi:hypothetical protein
METYNLAFIYKDGTVSHDMVDGTIDFINLFISTLLETNNQLMEIVINE